MMNSSLQSSLEKAINFRQSLMVPDHTGAFRLFNGFTEGDPDLVIDIYGQSLLIFDYSDNPSINRDKVHEVAGLVQARLDWLQSGVVKVRHSLKRGEINGKSIFGGEPQSKIREHGVWYAVNLRMNRDAGFYLDTRNLRKWIIDNAAGKTFLNSFAYTGSLGVAAMAGGAEWVMHLDRNYRFINTARESYSLNAFPVSSNDFLVKDFFPAISRLKQAGQVFDIVLLDPPFFSSTVHGTVDQQKTGARLINKVRPLIKDGGRLIAINNALYVSGREYMDTLESLCSDGYLSIEKIIPVPGDVTGFSDRGTNITDPHPFNHSTKIAVLGVKRKSG